VRGEVFEPAITPRRSPNENQPLCDGSLGAAQNGEVHGERRRLILRVAAVPGGVIGIAFGAGATVYLRAVFRWNAAVDPSSVGIAFAFAAAVGILFGVWPARRATPLKPIEALRYE